MQNKTQKAVRQAKRNELRFVKGVNLQQRKYSLPSILANISSDDRLRMAKRNCQDDFDRLRIASCIAFKGGLKQAGRGGFFLFKGERIQLPRTQLVAKQDAYKYLLMLTKLFNEKEQEEMWTPVIE